MPRRDDLRTILVVGSGPLEIGQGPELDCSGTQACRALREEGYVVVLVNPNPATPMTDPGTADRTYVEPLTTAHVARIIERERPDALLPTLGGRAGLALAAALAEDGTLARLGVELIGASLESIRRSEALAARFEDRERATLGWKPFDVEIVRDVADEAVVVCVSESLDPVGIHGGDAITVTPPQTLGEGDRQRLRDAALALVHEIGPSNGSASVRLALNPRDGALVAIGLSALGHGAALASRATGFPIARIVARLAVGYTLDELPDGLTGGTLADFEPAGDRCAVKIPRWAFERFPEADPTLNGRRRSVGEAMAVARTFKEALQKAARSVARGPCGLTLGRAVDASELGRLLEAPTPERLWAIADAYRAGWSRDAVHAATRIDPWFLDRIGELVAYERVIARRGVATAGTLRRAKRWGFPDARIAELTGSREAEVRALRLGHRITPAFRTVEACASGGAAYLYSTYGGKDEAPPTHRRKVVILGAGPNGIGQGPALDHGSVHAAAALRDRGLGAVIVSCNPATVSLDGDTPDRRYVEPLTLEDVLNVVDRERPIGVIAQLGGEAALALACPLERAGVVLLGTRADAIERAGKSRRPEVAASLDEAIGVDVDALSDGRRVFVAGVMEHIEKAGVHPADAACVLPPYSLGPEQVAQVHRRTEALARELGVVGLLNVRLALKDDALHVLEVTPGASRTIPFVSKAIGVPLVELATGILLGDRLRRIVAPPSPHVAVREAVFPFASFPGVDVVLGPEMKSTGEVMGRAPDFRQAYLKSQLAAGARLPTGGTVWLSARSCDRRPLVMLAKRLGELGFSVVAWGDTARVLARHGVAVQALPAGDGEWPRVLDLMRAGQITLAIDIPEDGLARARSAPARQEALRQNIPFYTTLDGAQAVIGAIEVLLDADPQVSALQDDLEAVARPSLARAA